MVPAVDEVQQQGKPLRRSRSLRRTPRPDSRSGPCPVPLQSCACPPIPTRPSSPDVVAVRRWSRAGGSVASLVKGESGSAVGCPARRSPRAEEGAEPAAEHAMHGLRRRTPARRGASMTVLVPVLARGSGGHRRRPPCGAGGAGPGASPPSICSLPALGAFSGAVLVRHPGHFRGFTVVGGPVAGRGSPASGAGSSATSWSTSCRAALTNPAYLTVAVAGGVAGSSVEAGGARTGTHDASSASRCPRSRCPSTRSSAPRRASRSASPPSGSWLATVAPTAALDRRCVRRGAAGPFRARWLVRAHGTADRTGVDAVRPRGSRPVAVRRRRVRRRVRRARGHLLRSWSEPIATALPDEGDGPAPDWRRADPTPDYGVTTAKPGARPAPARAASRSCRRSRWRRSPGRSGGASGSCR